MEKRLNELKSLILTSVNVASIDAETEKYVLVYAGIWETAY